MKKLLALILALTLVLGLVACGAKTETVTDAPEVNTPATNSVPAIDSAEKTPAEGDKVSFEIWVLENDLETYASTGWVIEAAYAYMEAHPEVEIQLTCISADPDAYQEKWGLGASTDTLPDLFPVNSRWLEEWSEAGLIADLSAELGNDQEFLDRFAPSAIPFANRKVPEGTLYGIPFKAETFGWLYNEQVFEACDLEIPETWSDLLNCVEVLNKNGYVPIAAAGIDNWATWGYHYLFERYGFSQEMVDQLVAGELTYAECEPVVKTLDAIEELAAAGAFSEDAYAMNHAQAMASFTSGEAAMYTTYSAIVGDTPEADRGFAEYCTYNLGPVFDDATLEGPSGLRMFDWVFACGRIVKSDPAKYAAVIEFIKFLMSEEGTAIQVGMNQPPATKCDFSAMDNLSPLEKDIYATFTADFTDLAYCFSHWYPSGGANGGYWDGVTALLCQTATTDEVIDLMQEKLDLWRASNS